MKLKLIAVVANKEPETESSDLVSNSIDSVKKSLQVTLDVQQDKALLSSAHASSSHSPLRVSVLRTELFAFQYYKYATSC
jgi:hypothetical protein